MKVWLKTLGWIAVWRAALVATALAAVRLIPFVPAFTPEWSLGLGLPYLAWIWGNFDGVVFMLISRSGYSAEQVVFFPLFPLLIRSVAALGLPTVYAGLAVSAIAFLVALYFIYRLLILDKKIGLYWLILALMLLFPTSVFYTAVYADALFLALASAVLYYSRQRRWFLAAVAGALAALARLNGLMLFGVIGAEYLLALKPELIKKWDWRLLRSAVVDALRPRLFTSGILWIFLIPASLIGFLAYIQLAFGDWHLFFSGVEVWHRSQLTFPLQTFWRYFKILFLYPRITFTYVVAGLEALFTLLYIAALVWSWGKIRLSYWLMILLHLLLPVMTGTLQGMPRYGLHLYPLFLIYGMFLQKKPLWVKGAWFAVSVALLAFYTMYYTRGYFVA